MTTCNYHFRPVGQGCFFTGIFTKNNKQALNFVYDCGTDTGGTFLDDAIKTFKSELRVIDHKPVIDLLMISHFDDDHVIGVLELLKGVKCRYLVMPFLSVFERLAIFSKGGSKAEWHKKFLTNPQAFINDGDYDIDSVIFIDGNNQTDDVVIPIPIDPGSPSPKSKPSSDPAYILEDEIKFDNKFLYYRIPFELEATDIDFKFKFYVKSYPEALISRFYDEVKLMFPGRSLSDLFNDYDRLRLKGLYKTIFKDRNKSSLVVAVIKKTFKQVYYHDNPNLLFPYGDRQTTIMLTGDISLKPKKQIATFNAHYAAEMDDVLLFQIPHHGSKYNSRLDLHTGLWNFPVYVVNHGSKSVSHPHPDVKAFASSNSKNVKYNTELLPLKLTYDVDY